MMDELLRRQSSVVSNHPSCMWGLLQFFNFHERLHKRKSIVYKRHNDNRRAGRTKASKSKLNVSSFSEEQELLHGEADFSLEDKADTTNRGRGKARLKSLISKLYKKQDQKQKISPSELRLLRTISIHHLECDDYVIPSESASDSETSTIDLGSVEIDSSVSSKDASMLPGRHNQANQLHDLLQRVLEKSNSTLENDVQIQHDSCSGPGFIKSRSFPGTGLAKHKSKAMSSFPDQESKSPAANSRNSIEDDSQSTALGTSVNRDFQIPKPGSWGGARTGSDLRSSPDSALNRFKGIGERIKDVVRENRKEQLRISMDGYLHKIPYGYKVSEDTEKEKPRVWDGPGSSSNRYRNSSNSIQRSRSLTDSVYKYSRLLESKSLRESRRPPERLSSVREQDIKFPKTLGRMFSNPEYGSFDFSRGFPSEPLNTNVSVNTSASALRSSDEPGSVSCPMISQDNNELETHAEDATVTEVQGKVLFGKHGDHESQMVSDGSVEEAVDSQDKTERPSPISVLGSYFQEDTMSPPKYSASEGSEVKPRSIVFEELDSMADSTSNAVESIKEDADFKRPFNLTDCCAINLQVKQKDEAAFRYVMDVLNKSCSNGEDPIETWPSLSNKPVNHHEHGIANDDSEEMTVDHQLLFDLISDVLLDLYENYSSHSVGVPGYKPRVRPKPVGIRLLEEVWTSIGWHLSLEPQLDVTLDYFVARDFARKDGWMSLQPDAECAVIEMVGLILDDLLDEFLYGD